MPYALDDHGGWRLDVAAVAAAIDARTKAVLVVSPNNPTGSVIDRQELDALAALTSSRGVALIGDEVFADYPITSGGAAVSVLQQARVADLRPRRPVEVRRSAPGEAGLDWRLGPPRSGRRGVARPGDRGRHVPVGVDAGAAGARRPVAGRRGGARADPGAGHAESRRAPPARARRRGTDAATSRRADGRP